MVRLKDKEYCSGCGGCAAACGVNAVAMMEDEEGFLFPVIDIEKCKNCRNCEKICQNISAQPFNHPTEVYAAIHAHDETLINSSSGGMFTALADYVLSRKGVVVGCVYEPDTGVYHIVTDEHESVVKMRGSKYVQSRIDKSVFEEIKRNLKQERKVLFTGTPCQVASLKGYLECDYENLITVDLICHGVPSPRFFNEYIKWREEKLKETIQSISFRSKARISKGISYLIELVGSKKTKHIYAWADPFYVAFAKSNNYRESCYSCKFACSERIGDITIGDYWGVQKMHPEVDTTKGISVVLVNTQKGSDVLQVIKNSLLLEKSTLEYAVKGQGSLRQPTKRPLSRDGFYEDIFTQGFKKWANKFFYSKAYYKSWILCKAGYLIPVTLRKRIKKFLDVT